MYVIASQCQLPLYQTMDGCLLLVLVQVFDVIELYGFDLKHVYACISVGPSIGWVERYARVFGVDIWHRVLVFHHSPYGY